MTDRYGRAVTYLRLSVTELCNLRCRYCMPEEGLRKRAHGDMLTEEEMVTAVKAAASLGVTKLRVTGGEPLVKRNILSICEHCGAVEGIRELCLTTNGTLLPPLAEPLRAAGVSRVNISLDTLDPAKYAAITRRGTLEDALAGIESALSAGFRRVKLNAVLMGGFNDDEIPALADLTRRWPVDVRFIELMPMYAGGFGPGAFLPAETVLAALPELESRPADGGVARLFRLPGAQGDVGLISPVSDHFCAACTRLRLTADGRIKPCLHSCQEYSVKGMDFAEMREQFRRAILAKPACHGTLTPGEISGAGRDMNQIGG